jgi:hypothetical protein
MKIPFISSLLESKPITEAKHPLAKIITSNFTREQPEGVTFHQLIKYHDRTPQLQIAVSSYSELITGTEMNVTCKSDAATKFLEDWIKVTNFYEKFENLVTTTLICGNSLMEKLDEHNIDDVLEVDMTSIISKKRDEFGKLLYYEQRTNNGDTAKLGEGSLGKFIEFNLTNYSRQSWGKSLFYSLAIPRTVGNRTTLPLVEIMWGIEDAMGAILLNNAYPITTITYPGASDTYLEKEATRWQRYKPGDKRVQKIKPEIEFFETQGNSKYTDFVTHIEKSFELGTQFPHDILTGDFTSRASSETTDNIVMKRVRGYQRYLANKLKMELFEPLLMQNGFDPENEDLQCQFTTQNIIELEVAQVKDLSQADLLSIGETRDWIRTNTGMELPDDKEVAQNVQDKKDSMEDKANGFKNKFAPKKESIITESEIQDLKKITKKLRKCKACKEGQHTFCTKRGCQCQ